MNSAAADLYEARWILTLDAGVRLLAHPMSTRSRSRSAWPSG